MRRNFWGFCRNLFLMSPLHYLSSRSNFGFEFAEIFVFEKRLPAITNTGSRRLCLSVIRRVANSPHHWYAESPTLRITDTRSRRLPASPIQRVGYWIFLKKTLRIDDTESRPLPAPVIRWVADYPCLIESESRRLRVSPIRRVDDSAYHRWVGSRRLRGSVTQGVAIQRKNKSGVDFQSF
jgi:hypothetical protein